jgi:hypothetical protein
LGARDFIAVGVERHAIHPLQVQLGLQYCLKTATDESKKQQ